MRFVILLLLFLPLSALAQDRPAHGLMWNKTGLPATFPLQIKTQPGRDYIVTLVQPDTNADAMAAYITGGRFFRLLVPPGTYRLEIDYGTVWQSETMRFADGKSLVLQDNLTFEIKGISRKAGHLIDLTELSFDDKEASAAKVTGQSLCQVARTEITPNCPPQAGICGGPDRPGDITSPYVDPPLYDFSTTIYTRLCD